MQSFLIRELTPRVATPIFTQAPAALCPNGLNTVQFSLAYCAPRAGQPATIYNWTAGNGLAIVSGQGSPTVVVRAVPGFLGAATLQVVATRTGYVASVPVSVTTSVVDGYVDPIWDLQGAQKVCPYTSVVVRVNSANVQPPYYWTEKHYRNGSPGPAATFTTQGDYVVSVDSEPVELTVTAQSVCTGQNVAAATLTITPYVNPNGLDDCNAFALRVAPNPAAGYVEVSTRPDNAPPAPPLPNHASPHAFQVRLHNGRGQVLQEGSTQDGLVRLSTAELPAGLYHVVVQRGRQVIRRNLSVQH